MSDELRRMLYDLQAAAPGHGVPPVKPPILERLRGVQRAGSGWLAFCPRPTPIGTSAPCRSASPRNPTLDFLMSVNYDATPLHPEARADLDKSGLIDATIRLQKIRPIAPFYVLEQLLGFDTPEVTHAYLIPYADPRGGWKDFPRVRAFPPYRDKRDNLVKYLQPRNTPSHVFFPLATLDAVLHSDAPLWCIEGEKKSLATAQLGLPSIGFAGIESWHTRGSRDLLPDFDVIRLRQRVVEVVPDGDWRTNTHVARGAERLALALEARGARARIVALPETVAA